MLSKYPVSRLYFLLAMAHLLIAALIGVLIRWHFLYTIPHFNYSHWIHAHSHIAFLGWVFLGLMAFINYYYERSGNFPVGKFKILAGWILAVNLGMLISFPIQGYGPVSIFFSAIHMFLGIYIFILYYPFLKKQGNLGFQLIRWGFIFMIISGIGPLMLGPVVALGYKQTQWYDFAIYFYLHFQYNGFFTLTILGLIIHHLEQHQQPLFLGNIRNPIVYGLVLAILLTYFLSVLGSEPPLVFYLLGALGAVIQIVIVILILITLLRFYQLFFHHDNFYINLMLVISLTCLETKLYLQFLSGIPAIADYVFDNRNIIIVYLHMVLLGFITSFLVAWWFKLNPYRMKVYFYWSVLNYMLGFLGSEIILLLYILKVFRNFMLPYQILFFFSVFIFLGLTGIFTGFLKQKIPEK